MTDLPDFTALADTDASIEASRIHAGEPWGVSEVAGLQFYRYARHDEIVGPVMPQPGDRLQVIRNPDNGSDRNACEIWWRNSHMLGHLPRGVARKIAPLMDAGQPLRAYVFHPGDGQAWSMSALLVGGALQPFHEQWIEQAVDNARYEQESIKRARANVGRGNGARFESELQDRRADRLLQAVNAFTRLPVEAALPPVGKTVEIGVIATALDVSRSTVFRMARKAGAAPRVHYVGWYAASATVEVTPALHAAMTAWCAAPRKRLTRHAVSAAVRRARDSHHRAYNDDDEDDIPF